MEYSIGSYCLINKRCISCNRFYYGNKFKEGIYSICKYCRKQKFIEESKDKSLNTDPYELMETMKNYRETILPINELKGDGDGLVLMVSWLTTDFNKITLEKAYELVKFGNAQVYSNDVIYSLKSNPRSQFLRRIVLKRDKNICYFCGKYGDTIDHLIPLSKRGLNILENLVCACGKCNVIKGNEFNESETKMVNDLTTKDHRKIKMKEIKNKKNHKSIDTMLNEIISNKKQKWE